MTIIKIDGDEYVCDVDKPNALADTSQTVKHFHRCQSMPCFIRDDIFVLRVIRAPKQSMPMYTFFARIGTCNYHISITGSHIIEEVIRRFDDYLDTPF